MSTLELQPSHLAAEIVSLPRLLDKAKYIGSRKLVGDPHPPDFDRAPSHSNRTQRPK